MSRLRHRDEHGTTLIEVSVVLLVLGVVLAAMFGFLDQITGLTARTDRHARAEGDAQIALRIATQNVRSALPILPCAADGASPALPTSYASCIKLKVPGNTSGVEACPYKQYVYALVNYSGVTKLVENREEISCAGASSNLRVRRVLLDDVANAGSEPLLSFYKADGTTIPATDAAAVPQASSIKMFLRVRYAPSAPTLSFSSIVAPRNNR